MIFLTVGSQKFQFNRLLKKIDELIKSEDIKEKVFAQIGVSDYKPKKYEYKDFLTQEEFNKLIEQSNLIITHAGTGVIINSVKRGKKVIGVPRLEKYGEHVDDHQIQIIKEFEKNNMIEPCYDIERIMSAINATNSKTYTKYVSSNLLIQDIKEFIEE